MKAQFLTLYRAALLAEFPWAQDTAKLDRFMLSVRLTITTDAATWNHDSSVAKRVYRELGNKAPYSRKALRAMPDDGAPLP